MDDERLKEYYARRSAHYERIYALPERQADLARLRALVPPFFAGRDVLELACGTGYWTALIAPLARSVFATDAGSEVLALARSKSYPEGRVRFGVADAFSLSELPASSRVRPGAGARASTGASPQAPEVRSPAPEASFNAAFAGFWWSHIAKGRIAPFLDGLHARLAPGSRVVFIDNRFVAGSSTPVTRRDGEGNLYQRRRLDDGTEHEVLKNFPSAEELRAAVGGRGRELEVTELTYYWCLSYLARLP
jgi:demethylmenaquinone methyltransferase/2-methoxy-6-polyprenyl-1,4-benzoquinol methylase